MEDSELLNLLTAHDKDALTHLTAQYGDSGKKIAANILGNAQDAEEVWNDALMELWNTIPPQRPQSLFAYLAVLIRNMAYDKCRAKTRKKRFGEQVRLALDELSECIPSNFDVEAQSDAKLIQRAVNDFLAVQPKAVRILFIQRYWAMMSAADIARKYGMNENTVRSTLRRTCERLRTYLEKEGYL
ncbi:MAG: RNA polymerase sigma factor [Oscillospiraceae bacterium]|nr:RNA polymerase sigma factor [Oscillospiraceae bacterium]